MNKLIEDEEFIKYLSTVDDDFLNEIDEDDLINNTLKPEHEQKFNDIINNYPQNKSNKPIVELLRLLMTGE
jgi:hypothetical protein